MDNSKVKIDFGDAEHGPILLSLMYNGQDEINLEDYVSRYNPRARGRIGRAFKQAVAYGIIEPRTINKAGKVVYRRTKACAELGGF